MNVNIPIAGYIYRFLNKDGEVIYIGKTEKDIKARMGSHSDLPIECYKSVVSIQYVPINYLYDLSKIEKYYIVKHKPKYNKQHIKNVNDFLLIQLEITIWQELDSQYFSHFKEITKAIGRNPDSKKGKTKPMLDDSIKIRQRYDKNNEQKRRKRRNKQGLLEKEQSKLNNVILVQQLSKMGKRNKDIVDITGLRKGTVSKYLKIDIEQYINN